MLLFYDLIISSTKDIFSDNNCRESLRMKKYMYLNIKKHNVIINIAKLMLGNDIKISLMKRRVA